MRNACPLPTRRPAALGLVAVLGLASLQLCCCEWGRTLEAAEVRPDAPRTVYAKPSARDANRLLFPDGAAKKFESTLLGVQTLRERAQERQVFFVSSMPRPTVPGASARLSAVVFVRQGDSWLAEAVERNIAKIGEKRMTDDPVDIPLLEIAPGRMAFLVPDGGYFQGIGEEGVRVLSYRPGHFADLGYVRVSANNQGACEEGTISKVACWEYKGRLSTQRGKSADYFDLRVRRTGERELKGRIVRATDVVYTFNGTRYTSRDD